MIGDVSPWALAGAEWGGPIPPKGITSYHLHQGGRIHFEKIRTSQIQPTPASNLPDFTFPIFVPVIEISHGSLIVGLSRQDSLQHSMDKDDSSIIQFFVQKVYVVKLISISHCLLIVRCQRWLELDEPNWEATWAGAGWGTSDELKFSSAKDCSLFVIFYLLSTDELAYLRQSTVEHFVTYET